jgi:acetoin utilization deacetylase AcuC-like enzyme
MTNAALLVFYTPAMVAPSGCFSPSAAKPEKVVASWLARGIPLRVREPAAATVDELALAHDRTFIADVLAGRADNGFRNRSTAVAATLPYTTGAMLTAARHVRKHGGAAAAPCSGFHHAGYAKAAGYCTFNGLMVTACAMKREGARRIGILDCDLHYGDGTDAIIGRLGAEAWIRHFTAGESYRWPSQAETFLARLPSVVDEMADCDIVLYQAGADPHIDDPSGGWLTTGELRARDACVFERLHALGVPVVWNLAGGYQVEPDGSIPRVLEIHDNTAIECLRVFGEGRTD